GPSYKGVWGMGLVGSALGENTQGIADYAWNGPSPLTFTIAVLAPGGTAAATSFERRFSKDALIVQPESLASVGFAGMYVAPAGAVGRPALLVFGGSEGGLSTVPLAELLAAHGYPALALAYWRLPGLPETLSGIPLEYFANALHWLARQPQV